MADESAVEVVTGRQSGRREILSLSGVSFGFASDRGEVPILEGLDLSISAGEFVAVFGPSGVGKSTLLRAIAGLIEPREGNVTVNEHHLRGRSPVGFVFQEPRLLPWRSVVRNVEYGLEGSRLSRFERRSRAKELLSLVGLSGHEAKWPRQLSGGQRQRVGIARALAVRPDLLLMDEPFSSLDAVTRKNLHGELLRIWEATGTSILFVTHDLEEAVLLADRLVLLAGTPACVARRYAIDEPRPRDLASPSIRATVRAVTDELHRVSG